MTQSSFHSSEPFLNQDEILEMALVYAKLEFHFIEFIEATYFNHVLLDNYRNVLKLCALAKAAIQQKKSMSFPVLYFRRSTKDQAESYHYSRYQYVKKINDSKEEYFTWESTVVKVKPNESSHWDQKLVLNISNIIEKCSKHYPLMAELYLNRMIQKIEAKIAELQQKPDGENKLLSTQDIQNRETAYEFHCFALNEEFTRFYSVLWEKMPKAYDDALNLMKETNALDHTFWETFFPKIYEAHNLLNHQNLSEFYPAVKEHLSNVIRHCHEFFKLIYPSVFSAQPTKILKEFSPSRKGPLLFSTDPNASRLSLESNVGNERPGSPIASTLDKMANDDSGSSDKGKDKKSFVSIL